MEGHISISNSLADKMNIPLKPYIFIRYGVRIIKTKLEISYETDESFNLSLLLSQALLVQAGARLQIRYDHAADMLHLGPVIGILTSVLPRREEYLASSLQAELIYLSNIGRTLPAQIYIFTPACIDWDNQCTRGYVYRSVSEHHGIWEAALYPLPDVVYDRISTRKAEARPLIKTTKRKLMSLPDLKYFNQSFFNKWRVYEMLVGNPAISPYLPETRLLNQANLKEMAGRYRVLYIKPANGSLGQGIIKTFSKGDGRIYFSTQAGHKYNGSADHPAQFLERTKAFRKQRTYIVQQGIELAKYKDSAFDIRIIYQKNGEGKWLISKKFIRVAARGSSISNLSKGGRPEQSKTVLGEIYKHKKRLIEQKNTEMKNLCANAADAMEAAGSGILGELGLDIGIDQQGKLWLIEVNSKPRKTTETEMSRKIVHNTFKRPLEYSIYLAGFTSPGKRQSH